MVLLPHVLLAYAIHEFAYAVGKQQMQVADLSSHSVGASHHMVIIYTYIMYITVYTVDTKLHCILSILYTFIEFYITKRLAVKEHFLK